MKNRISTAIFTAGFSGIAGQLVLLRELLIVFSGNELSIGIILANWLILEASGSYFAGKKAGQTEKPIAVYAVITILFSLSLPLMIYITRILRIILGLSIGEAAGILPILCSSFFILMPVSFFHGSLFTFGCRIYSASSESAAAAAGKVYFYEVFGTIAGGIAWTYFFIPYFHAFDIAAGVAALNFLVCTLLLFPSYKSGRLIQNKAALLISFLPVISGIYITFSGIADKLHHRSIEAQWTPQNLVHYQNSIYGNICVTEIDGQYTFFLDGASHIKTPVPDIAFVEEFVHLPLLLHPGPEKILILGGGAGGVINEILKHPSVNLVDYAELDPVVIELIRKFPTPLTEHELSDERVKVTHIDGRLFLKKTETRYDIILAGLKDLSDLQSNRFFTREFYSLAEKKLNPKGILAAALPGSFTYLSEELKNLNSSVYYSIKSIFPHVRVIPGDSINLFLASNSSGIELFDKTELTERVYERDLKANIIVPRHIEHKLHPGWEIWFLDFIKGSKEIINHDLRPVGVFYSIAHWNSVLTPALRGFFRWAVPVNIWLFIIIFTVSGAGFFIFSSGKTRFRDAGIPLSIGTTGFAGMIFDLALIFVFQSLYGYVFAWIGLLVTSFMAGSACGAMIITSFLPKIKNNAGLFIMLDLVIICFTLILPFVFLFMQPFLESPSVILILSFISGLIVSAQFPLANSIYLEKNQNLSRTAGLLYGADLTGGWIGGILGGVILLPVLGLTGTCMAVALVKLSSLAAVTAQSNNFFKRFL